ncbi:MAG: hypothetical protein FD153_573 [Rhodospirillaceae bacterium]|nr:MAG: hypothetical protein FD153_573 [Rhodospirillaceae bacterium]
MWVQMAGRSVEVVAIGAAGLVLVVSLFVWGMLDATVGRPLQRIRQVLRRGPDTNRDYAVSMGLTKGDEIGHLATLLDDILADWRTFLADQGMAAFKILCSQPERTLDRILGDARKAVAPADDIMQSSIHLANASREQRGRIERILVTLDALRTSLDDLRHSGSPSDSISEFLKA